MIDEKLLADLKHEEGWRAHAYQDSLGFWSLGWGFLIDKRRQTGGLPQHIAEQWLEWIVYDRQRELEHSMPWIREQPPEVQRALIHMAYQLGVGGLLGFRRMLAALQSGNRLRAAEEALDSAWARQTPARANRVAALIRGPVPNTDRGSDHV